MAFMFVLEARTMQCYRHSFSHNQQTPWICHAYRSASKSSGPLRYVPRNRRETPGQWHDEQRNSHGLSHPNEDEGTNKHVRKDPSKAQKVLAEPRLVGWGHLGRQQKPEADASCLDEDDGTFLQPFSESSCKLKTGSFGAPISTQSMLVPSQSSHSQLESLKFSCNLRKERERSTVTGEEELRKQPVYGKPRNDADRTDKIVRHLPRSSADWDLSTLQADVIRNADAENVDDMVKTRERDFLNAKVGRAAFLQASKRSASLSIQGKHMEKGEVDVQGRKAPPWQDAESFLSKVQKAKSNRSLEPLQMRQTAAATESVVGLCDNEEFTEDDRFRLFEQETPEESEVHEVGLHGTAEQEYAKNQAILHLSRRPYTAAELRKKLVARSIAPSLADYAVATVQLCGLQSDLAYAETFSSARFSRGSWGPQRIKLGLKQRGVKDEIIKVALDRVFGEEEGNIRERGVREESSTSSSVKISKAAMDHLLLQATKQWNRGKNATNETKIRRMVSWLQYRGFNYGIVKHVLKHLQRETPMEDDL